MLFKIACSESFVHNIDFNTLTTVGHAKHIHRLCITSVVATICRITSPEVKPSILLLFAVLGFFPLNSQRIKLVTGYCALSSYVHYLTVTVRWCNYVCISRLIYCLCLLNYCHCCPVYVSCDRCQLHVDKITDVCHCSVNRNWVCDIVCQLNTRLDLLQNVCKCYITSD